MDDWSEGRAAAAIEQALRIPGVHGAGTTFRWKNGIRTSERVLCVYVDRKQRLDEIAPRDRVPAEILGMPTDVMEADFPRHSADLPEIASLDPDPGDSLPFLDGLEYPQLRGGIRVHGAGAGTLGCIARAMDAENTSKLVVLSNHHVLLGFEGEPGASVYQPERTSCCCGRKIGVVLRGINTMRKHYVDHDPSVTSIDAAIALLDPGVPCLGEIQVGIGPGTATELVKGVLTRAQLKTRLDQGPVLVKKRGLRTAQTMGVVTSDDLSEARYTDDESVAFARQVTIEPIVPPNTVDGYFNFSGEGDSGSLIRTTADDLGIALHHGSRNIYPKAKQGNRKLVVTQSVATPIDAVTQALEIEIVTTNVAGQVLTNPAPSELEAGFAPQPAFARSMLARAREDIERTQHGRTYAELIRRHHTEVSRLINANKRVGAVWKRNGGQKLVQMLFDAIARPNVPIPSAIGERTIAEAASRISAILRRFGSTALVRDLAVYERAVPRLCGCTYNQLLGRLRAGEPVLE